MGLTVRFLIAVALAATHVPAASARDSGVASAQPGVQGLSVAPMRAEISDPDGFTNIRSEPDFGAYVIARAIVGEEFLVTPSASDWWRVALADGTTGYIHRSRVRGIDGRAGAAREARESTGFQTISDAVGLFEPDPHFGELRVRDFAHIDDVAGIAEINASQSYVLPPGSSTVVIFYEENNAGTPFSSAYAWTGAKWADVTSGVLLSPDGPEGAAEWLRISRNPDGRLRFLDESTGKEVRFVGGRFKAR